MYNRRAHDASFGLQSYPGCCGAILVVEHFKKEIRTLFHEVSQHASHEQNHRLLEYSFHQKGQRTGRQPAVARCAAREDVALGSRSICVMPCSLFGPTCFAIIPEKLSRRSPFSTRRMTKQTHCFPRAPFAPRDTKLSLARATLIAPDKCGAYLSCSIYTRALQRIPFFFVYILARLQ